MGTRTLESRLTSRFLLVAAAVSALVSVAAIVLTDRALDAEDTSSARAVAVEARDLVERELREGDPLDDALDEVVSARAGAAAATVRITARAPGLAPKTLGGVLPALGDGACATTAGPGDDAAWRACGAVVGPATLVAAVPLSGHRQAIATLVRGLVLVNAIGLVALWFVVRRAVRRPVRELAALVRWTAQVADLGSTVAPPAASSREVADLATAFDALVRRLIDVLDRERASSAHIAHELRTPLTAMRAEIDALGAAPPPPATLAKIRAEVARFGDVIDAIVVLSSSERGARSRVVVNVADLARTLAPPGIPVDGPDEALVEADEPLLALALRNLIDNADRHGRGVRAIEVSREGQAVRVAVVDDGPGVGEAERGRMFDRYWRAAEADGDGRGLGLALVKAVAERHDGSAEATPGPAGHGLRVSFTLGHVRGWYGPPASPG
jgi:signal transduction histidine kinase